MEPAETFHRIVAEFEKQDWSALIILGLALNMIGHRFCPRRNNDQYRIQAYAGRFAAALSMPYLIFLYPQFLFHNPELLLTNIIQIGLCYFILYGVGLLLIPQVLHLNYWMDDRSRRFGKLWADRNARRQKQREQRKQERWNRANPPPSPRSRPEFLKEQMSAAQSDYESEAQLIEQSTILDDDEKHVALQQLKQRFINKFNEFTK